MPLPPASPSALAVTPARGSPSPGSVRSPPSSAQEQPSPATLPFGSRLFPGCPSSGIHPGRGLGTAAQPPERRDTYLPSPGRLCRPLSPSCPAGPGRTRSQRGARKGPGAVYREGCWVGGSSPRARRALPRAAGSALSGSPATAAASRAPPT